MNMLSIEVKLYQGQFQKFSIFIVAIRR